MGSLKQRRKARAAAQAESGGTNVGDPMPHGSNNSRDEVPRKTKKEQVGVWYAKRRV